MLISLESGIKNRGRGGPEADGAAPRLWGGLAGKWSADFRSGRGPGCDPSRAPDGSGAPVCFFPFLFSFFDLQLFLDGRFHEEPSAFEFLEQTFLDELTFKNL